MARYLSLVIGLCILSLVAVVLLSASPEEKLELSLSRLPPNDALIRLNEVFRNGDRTPNLLMRRAELLSATGAFDEARDTLEKLAEVSSGRSFFPATVGELPAPGGEARAARATRQADLARMRAEAQGVEALLARLRADLEAAQRAGAHWIWCNARTHAAGFYARHGFRTQGGVFDIPTAGPHYRMLRPI